METFSPEIQEIVRRFEEAMAVDPSYAIAVANVAGRRVIKTERPSIIKTKTDIERADSALRRLARSRRLSVSRRRLDYTVRRDDDIVFTGDVLSAIDYVKSVPTMRSAGQRVPRVSSYR